MDLNSGSTPWRKLLPTGLTRWPLSADETCDVAVVGSGLSGALTAFHLARAGADVVVVDKRPLASGSTTLTTALVQYELDTPLVELTPHLGLADAQSVYRATRGALNDLRTLVETHNIDCDLEPRPTLYLARHDDDIVHLKHEALARSEIGIEASFIDASALSGRYNLHRPGAILSSVSYELDPRKLAAGLFEASTSLGARIYDRTPLLPTNPSTGSSTTLRTATGHRIEAEHVVYATGYEALDAWPDIAAHCSVRTTYAAATVPISADRFWPERAMLWELGDPYFYARTTSDDRVIVGGEDDFTFDTADRERITPMKARRLLQQLKSLTGVDAEAQQAWAATFVRSRDGLPFIGAWPGTPRCLFNLGFGGNGIVFALIGAQVVRDTIAGRAHPAARLLGFERRSLVPSISRKRGSPMISQPVAENGLTMDQPR